MVNYYHQSFFVHGLFSHVNRINYKTIIMHILLSDKFIFYSPLLSLPIMDLLCGGIERWIPYKNYDLLWYLCLIPIFHFSTQVSHPGFWWAMDSGIVDGLWMLGCCYRCCCGCLCQIGNSTTSDKLKAWIPPQIPLPFPCNSSKSLFGLGVCYLNAITFNLYDNLYEKMFSTCKLSTILLHKPY